MGFAGHIRNWPDNKAAVGVVGAMVVTITARALGSRSEPGPIWLLAQLPGAAFTLAGIATWVRRPNNGTGRLMLVLGITWYAADLRTSPHAGLAAAAFLAAPLPLVASLHLLLAAPTGRLERWGERLNIAGQYGSTLALQFVQYRSASPTVADLQRSLMATLAVVTVLQILRKWQAGRLRFAELMVRLESATPEFVAEPDRLRAALAGALRDPTVDVLFPLPDGRGYVDVEGRAAAFPPTDGRACTPVERHGRPLAVLMHDPTLVERGPVVETVVATAGLAFDNARLYAELRSQLDEVRASRARIVMAADAERRRIQRDLHDGVQHALLATSMLVRRARDAGRLREGERVGGDAGRLRGGERVGGDAGPNDHLLAEADGQLTDVIRQLRELSQGIHPPALTEQGLAAAIEVLAERAPLPVVVDIPAQRWPEHSERAAYFVVSEALANVYKHANAGRAHIRVRDDGGLLVVEVTDDGSGGADPSAGTGLRGLDDRVGALGGAFRIESPANAGTRIMAELPCG